MGDNLAMNGACGFVESFKAHRYCRICRANNQECQYMTDESCDLLRNFKNYHEDVAAKNIKTGVKEDCVVNQVKNFHITNNKSQDLMHDLVEGVIRTSRKCHHRFSGCR